jgi:hypothetical protein
MFSSSDRSSVTFCAGEMDGLRLTFRRRPHAFPPIPLALDPGTLSILLTHRALIHAFRDDHISALRDSVSALSFDPDNAPALLQRANSSYSLGHFPDASRDYAALASRSMLPRALASRVLPASDDFAERVSAISLPIVLPGGLELDFFTSADARALMDDMRRGTLPPTPLIVAILDRGRVMHGSLPNIVSIQVGEIKVVGDTHGQFQDLIFIFETFGFPSRETPYLFNGDYVDRGSQGIEIVLTLLAFKIADPDAIFLNRGNQYFFFH